MSKETGTQKIFNQSTNESLSSVMERRLSRRSMLQGSVNVAAMTMLGGFGLTLSGCNSNDSPSYTATPITLGFNAIAGSRTDAVVVPTGYHAQVLVSWGTPLNDNATEWSEDLAITPDQQANSVGMHHDGMYHFPLSADTTSTNTTSTGTTSTGTASSDFILAVNHEYIDQDALWKPKGGATNNEKGVRPADEARTEINAHGITLVRVQKQSDGRWTHVKNSPYNRRITTATPVNLAGPVAGSDYVKTAYSTDGMETRGTNSNCGCGFTPWGTYLSCEENWPSYFCKSVNKDDARIGLHTDRGRYGWETAAQDTGANEVNGEFKRFDATPSGASATDDYRNEPRTFGYIVEVDPYTNTRAVKRTHLGRFRHEGCWPGKLVIGEPVVFYSGHDSLSEYIYRFVSEAVWDPTDANRPGEQYDRLAIGAKYMDKGTLYVAQFNDDGTGTWLPLTPDATTKDGQPLSTALGLSANDLAGIIINTCDAADFMGATPMDRPEWGTVDPTSGQVYMTLTNNWRRRDTYTYTNNGSNINEIGVGYDQVPTDAANPRQFPDNEAGHIISWRDSGTGSTTFTWEIFAFGAGTNDTSNPSGLTEFNQFGNPDGLWYDDRGDGQGILWIETDNGYDPVENYTNDQVLAVVTSSVSRAADEPAVINPSNQDQLKRFAVGPNGCEVTGIFAPPDKTALFINIQHPGNWPSSLDATVVTANEVRPRASTVVIEKIDGGKVGE